MPFFDSRENLKDTIILTVGRLAVSLGSIVSLRVLSELVSPSQLGVFYYIMAIGSFFSLVLFNPVMVYVNRSCIKWFHDMSGRGNIRWIFRYALLAALLCAGVLIGYWFWGEKVHAMGLVYVGLLVPLIVLSDNIISTGSSIMNFLNKRLWYVALNNLQIWGVFIGTVFAIMAWDKRADMMLLGRAFAQVVLAALIMYVVWKAYKTALKDHNQTKSIQAREVWNFCWPLALTQVFFWSQYNGFRIPLKTTGGELGLGIFSVIFGAMVGLFAFFDWIFNQFYTPIFWKNVTLGDFKNVAVGQELSLYLKKHWSALIVFALWAIGVAPFAFRIFVAQPYRGYPYLVLLIALSETLRISGAGITYSINAINKNYYLFLPAILCLVMCIGGVYVLGLLMNPLLGAGMSLALSCFLQLTSTVLLLRKDCNFKLPWRQMLWAFLCGLPLWLLLHILAQTRLAANVGGCFSIILISGLGLLGVLFLLRGDCTHDV